MRSELRPDCLFCLTNSPISQSILNLLLENTEKQEILKIEQDLVIFTQKNWPKLLKVCDIQASSAGGNILCKALFMSSFFDTSIWDSTWPNLKANDPRTQNKKNLSREQDPHTRGFIWRMNEQKKVERRNPGHRGLTANWVIHSSPKISLITLITLMGFL